MALPRPTTHLRQRRGLPARQAADPEPTSFILPETGYELDELERRASIVTIQSTLNYVDPANAKTTTSSFPVGAVVGGVVGGIVIVLIAGGLYWWWSGAAPKSSRRRRNRPKAQPTLPGRVPIGVSTKAAGAGAAQSNEKLALSPTSYQPKNSPHHPTPSVRSVSGGSDSGLLANQVPLAGAAVGGGQQQQSGGRSPTKKGYQPSSGRSPTKAEPPISPTKNYQPNKPSPLAAKAETGPKWGEQPFVAPQSQQSLYPSTSPQHQPSTSPTSSYESGSPFNTPSHYSQQQQQYGAPQNVYSLNAPPPQQQNVSPTKSAIPRHLSAASANDNRLSSSSLQSDESHYSDAGVAGRAQSGEWGVSYENDSRQTEQLYDGPQVLSPGQPQEELDAQAYDPYAIRVVRESGGNYPEEHLERYYRRTGEF